MTQPGGYRTLIADPPWKLNDKLPWGGSERHYKLMSTPDLMNFELPEMADDSILLLWRLSCFVEDAYKVCRAWGFTPKTELIWLKRTVKGNRWFGMGNYTRAEHETCIIATRGKPKPLIKNIRSTFEAPVGRHSAKPDEFYNIVEKLCAGPYVELFARRHRPGWTCLGDQVGEAA